MTVKNSIIRGGTGNNGLGIVSDVSNTATNFLLEDSEVVPQYPVVNLDDVKGWNYTLLRDNIHGSVDGLKMYGNNATVQDSWIHDLVTYAHDPAQNNGPSHSDGVQILSGTNLKVIGNNIEGQPNSTVIITQDNGPVSNVLDRRELAQRARLAAGRHGQPAQQAAGVVVRHHRHEQHLRGTAGVRVPDPR